MKKVIVDIGSSTVKVYKFEDGKSEIVIQKSFNFKDNYSQRMGLHFNDEEGLVRFLERVNANYFNYSIEAYATGIFRQLSAAQLGELQLESRKRAKIEIKILTHEEENYYLEKAFLGRARTPKTLLLLNIGGATTELVLVKDGAVIDRVNLEIGVGVVNGQFPELNDTPSLPFVKDIKRFIMNILPDMSGNVEIAIFSGGELHFMELLDYCLEPNRIFMDNLHPKMITLSNFIAGNQEVIFEKSVEDMALLYPDNPKWVSGSRACEIIAESIFEKYGVEYIIPSDANLADGIIADMLHDD
jgi:hypothetical protein